MTTYRSILDSLRSMSPEAEAGRTKALWPPTRDWPYGMPGAIDARMVIVGTSPGGSRSRDGADQNRIVVPQRLKTPDSWFYYPDGKHYWDRMRQLALGWFRRGGEAIDELEAISLTAHLNLSTTESGDSSKVDAEADMVRWVTHLVETVYDVELVVLVGMKGKLQRGDLDLRWRDATGGMIAWGGCRLEGAPISISYGKESKALGWLMRSTSGRPIAVVATPNHPSRHPFGQGVDADRRWTEAVESMVELGDRLLADAGQERTDRDAA